MSEIITKYSQSEQVGELVAALAKAKLKYGEVVKSKENKYTGSLYADLQDLMTAAERPLAEENVVVVHFPVENIEQKKAGAFTKIIHASGQFFANEFLMPATGKATGGVEKLDAQTVTGGVTYAKRCNYGALAGLVGEDDDDGNNLADKSQDVAAPPKPKQVKAPEVNRAPAKSDANATRPNEVRSTTVPALPQKPVTVTSVASQTNDPAPAVDSGVPKAVIPSEAPVAPSQPEIPFSSPSEQVSPKADNPKSTQTGTVPNKTQFDGYTARAMALKQPLEKAGLKPSKNLTTGAKLKAFLLSQTGAKELTELTTAQWDGFFTKFEPLIQTDAAGVVAQIEGGADGSK